MPKFEPFPEKGLLQFYFALVSNYGIDLADETFQKQINWKVQYFEDFDETNATTDFSELIEEKNKLLKKNRTKYDPFFNKTFALEFTKGMSFPGRMSKTYEDIIEPLEYEYEDNMPLDANALYFDEIYGDKFIGEIKHQIGGYSYFVQNNLVESNYEEPLFPGWINLLQIDSQFSDADPDNPDFEISIGSGGVMNLLISEVDLKNKDFSKVAFDCQYS